MASNKEKEFDDFIAEFELYVTEATVNKNVLKFTGTTLAVDKTNDTIRMSYTCSVNIQQRYSDRTKVKRIPMSSGVNLRTAEQGPSLLSDTGTFRFIADRARPDMLWESCLGKLFLFEYSDASYVTAKSEIKAIDVLIKKLLHIIDLTRFAVGLPIKIYCDNKSAPMIFETLKTNHPLHSGADSQRTFAIYFVPTEHNVADLLTKPLPVAQFEYLRDIMMRGHGGVEP
eukprot:gene47245-biopygen3384